LKTACILPMKPPAAALPTLAPGVLPDGTIPAHRSRAAAAGVVQIRYAAATILPSWHHAP